MTKLLNILILQLKIQLYYMFFNKKLNTYSKYRNNNKIFLFLAADYGNLGDVAITYAQEYYLKTHYPKHTIIKIPISETLSSIKSIKNICSKEDIITIIGGGNMSDIYFDIELLRQFVIKHFKDHQIISFPQTLFYSDTISGKYMFYLAKKCYKNNKNIILMARESISYKKMSKHFSCQVILTPDIVMYLDKSTPPLEREGITFCMRNDKEKKIDSEHISLLKKRLQSNNIIFDYDTHIGRDGLTHEECQFELTKIWNHFKRSKWVITDRLHGMIFCFITKTPCIVLPNNNYKIEKCYEWIKECGYIFLMNDYDEECILSTLNKSVKDNFNDIHRHIINHLNQ